MSKVAPPSNGPQASTVLLGMCTVGILLAGVVGFMLFVSHRKQLEHETRIEALEEALGAAQHATSPTPRAALMRDPNPRVIHALQDTGVYTTSIGSAHGARPGHRVRVLRGGVPIAEILLDSVEPTASAGTLVGAPPKVHVRKGDPVELIRK